MWNNTNPENIICCYALDMKLQIGKTVGCRPINVVSLLYRSHWLVFQGIWIMVCVDLSSLSLYQSNLHLNSSALPAQQLETSYMCCTFVLQRTELSQAYAVQLIILWAFMICFIITLLNTNGKNSSIKKCINLFRNTLKCYSYIHRLTCLFCYKIHIVVWHNILILILYNISFLNIS